MRPFCILLAGSLAFAAGGVEPPSVGYARGSDGSIIHVAGLSGAFITSATDQTGVISAGFSKQLAVLKRASTVHVLDSSGNLIDESDAPPGSALIGFDAYGGAAIAWYPSTQALMLFRDGEWSPAPFDAGGMPVVAVALRDAGHALVVLARDRLSLARIRISDGATEDETVLGPGAGPALLTSRGDLLFQRGALVVYRTSEGAEQTLAVPADVSELVPMGGAWVQARTASGRSLALRLEREGRTWELPEVSQ